MGRVAKNVVSEITVSVLRKAFDNPAAPGRSYYIQERGGRHSIPGCFLRVLRTEVWFGTRTDTWIKVAQARADMTPEEILSARQAVRQRIRDLEEVTTKLGNHKRITVRELMEQYFADWRSGREDRRSPRTEEGYQELWNKYLLPYLLKSGKALGDMPIQDVTPEIAQEFKMGLPTQAAQRTPHASRGGRVVTNRALQQAQAAFSFAVRMRKTDINPFSEEIISRYPEEPGGYCFTESELRAIGAALDRLEALAARPRSPLPIRSIAGIRLLLLTGARASEITEAYTDKRYLPAGSLAPYALLDDPFPRIFVQRAKGDRGGQKRSLGRFIWLAARSVRVIHTVPRVPGDVHVLPGDIPGDHIQRLNAAFSSVLREAGVQQVPLKSTRHTFRSWAPEAGVSPEHVQQLLGHAGLRITDRVYLHTIAPALMAAAERVAEFMAARLEGQTWTPGAAWEPYTAGSSVVTPFRRSAG